MPINILEKLSDGMRTELYSDGQSGRSVKNLTDLFKSFFIKHLYFSAC